MRSVFGRGSAGSAGRLRTIFDDSEEDEDQNGGGGAGAYVRAPDGRLLISEERSFGKRRRDGDDGDGDARSLGGKSHRSSGGKSSQGGRSQKRVRTGTLVHSAGAFRSKKSAGGDVSRTGGVQPYAYWPMDAKLLNRRAGRRRQALTGLDQVVRAVRNANKNGKRN